MIDPVEESRRHMSFINQPTTATLGLAVVGLVQMVGIDEANPSYKFQIATVLFTVAVPALGLLWLLLNDEKLVIAVHKAGPERLRTYKRLVLWLSVVGSACTMLGFVFAVARVSWTAATTLSVAMLLAMKIEEHFTKLLASDAQSAGSSMANATDQRATQEARDLSAAAIGEQVGLSEQTVRRELTREREQAAGQAPAS